MIRQGSLIGYLRENHPDILVEAKSKLLSSPTSRTVFSQMHSRARKIVQDDWQVKLVTITAALLYSSPETLYSAMPIRNGVAKTLGCVLDVTKQAVSKKLDQARHYYTHVAWCRDAVDKIVKEVRGE